MTHTPVTIVDDGNPCTADQCHPRTGRITHTPLPNGTHCDDGNAANGLDECHGGNCIPAACSATTPIGDGNLCTLDTCDPQRGILHTPLPDYTVCDTGNRQYRGYCISGVCIPNYGFVAVGEDQNVPPQESTTPPSRDEAPPCLEKARCIPTRGAALDEGTCCNGQCLAKATECPGGSLSGPWLRGLIKKR